MDSCTVVCTACGLAVPPDRAATLSTPVGGMTVCVACHPSPTRHLTPHRQGDDHDG